MIACLLRRCAAFLALCLSAALGFAQVNLAPTDGGSEPLVAKSIACDVKLNGPVADITQTWIFSNSVKEGRRFEADMELTVTPGHVLTGFAYWLGEEKVPAFIVSKRRASMIYDVITTRQQDPALIEKIGKNKFRVRIFPVDGAKDLRVELRSVQAMTGGQLRVQFPADVRRPLDKFNLNIQGLPPESGWSIQNSWKLPSSGTTIAFAKEHYKPQAEFRLTCKPKSAGWWAAGWGARSGSSSGAFAVTVQGANSNTAPTLSGLKCTSVHKARTAGSSWLITGRYEGSGDLIVKAGGSKKRVPLSQESVPNHAALKLWAQAEIDSLGTSDKVRHQVIKLSGRHGLPSHFTSWLAIPTAERERFKEEIRESVIDELQDEIIELELAKRHNSELYKELSAKLIKELELTREKPESSWRDRFWEREWELQMAYAKAVLTEGQTRSANRIAQAYELMRTKAKMARRESLTEEVKQYIDWYLGRVGDAWLTGELPHSRFAAAIRRAAPHLDSKTRYQVTHGDFSALGMDWTVIGAQQSLTMRKLDPKSDMEGSEAEIIARARSKYPRWTAEMCTVGKGNALYEFFLSPSNSSRADFGFLYGEPDKVTETQMNGLVSELDSRIKRARKLFRTPEIQAAMLNYPLIRIGAVDVYRIRKASTEGKSFEGPTWTRKIRDRFGFTPTYERRVYESALQYDFEEYRSKYQAANRNLKEIAAMEASYRFLSKFVEIGDWKAWRYKPRDSEWQWDYPQYQERSEFLKSLRHEPDAKPLKVTEEAFRAAMKKAKWGRYTDERVEVRINLIKTEVEMEQLGLLQQTPEVKQSLATLQERRESLRARLGDPVLFVNAPKSSRAVTALLPDGELKLLTWNESRRQWELRFDVPGYVNDGKYTIAVTVITAEGKREKLNFQFDVDTDAPIAQWKWSQDSFGGWVLIVETGTDVARIEAFLAERRLNLVKVGPGRFELHLDGPAPLMLAITDQAHNRSALEVTLP